MKNKFEYKVATSLKVVDCFNTCREKVLVSCLSELSDVAVLVIAEEEINSLDVEGVLTVFRDVPVFVLIAGGAAKKYTVYNKLVCGRVVGGGNVNDLSCGVESAAEAYEKNINPYFFRALTGYVSKGNVTFACPGHQGSSFFSKHPAGQKFLEFFGENLFKSDVPHADPALGDLLSHYGPPGVAEEHAAAVFNADKTYFVLNGTSASNKIVANALLAEGDVVLFDRNNHKSCYHGALIQAGATPLYLEALRNAWGVIGGVPTHCFDECYLRARLKKIAPQKAADVRPFRLAILQSGTWDGSVYNVRQVVERIGHLCEYILFDSAWLGYEQFIEMMRDCSPLLLELGEDSPGVIVTQSVHKQMAGLSQTSQIHKKDNHISLQSRYCDHVCFNNSFMLHASTSPFYPLFASLDVNAKIHSQGSGERLWEQCFRVGIEARKLIFSACEMITPFVPPLIGGKAWQDYETSMIFGDMRFFEFSPTDTWHGFNGYGKSQYFIDPCKLLLTTCGVNSGEGNLEGFGIPAIVLAHYLREHGVVPEKSDLYSIVFLLTPATDIEKINALVTEMRRFEIHFTKNSLLKDVLPSVYKSDPKRYENYGVRELCQTLHLLYSELSLVELQRRMFAEDHLPQVLLSASKANEQLVRRNVELLPLNEAYGRIAAEGVVPYPPGILCLAPGEVWEGAVFEYVLAAEKLMNNFSVFSPEIQGLHLRKNNDGKQVFHCSVIK